MADIQLATALSNISVSGPPAKLPNFPLPRELRDQIYGYLLDGEYVRIKRIWSRKEYEDNFDNDRSGPRAYHFHTNVLGVNRAIHDEAEELLYKRSLSQLGCSRSCWRVVRGNVKTFSWHVPKLLKLAISLHWRLW